LWHSLIVLGFTLALFFTTYLLLRNGAMDTERDMLDFRLNQYVGEYERGGLGAVRQMAAIRKGRAQKAFFVRVGDTGNRTLFMRDPEEWVEFAPQNLERQPLPAEGARDWQILKSDSGVDMTLISWRLSDGGVLQVGKSNEGLREVLETYRHTAGWLVLILVPASFAGGAFLASRALRPVQHLTSAAQGIIETARFDARVPARGSGDELDALVRVFNEMLERIDDLVRSMRDSIDNVAHDLRTPLMRLSQKAQNLIEAHHARIAIAPCSNCAAAIEALGDCVEEADRVTTMLNMLMDIEATEAGIMKLNAEPARLDAIVERAVEAYAEFAEERNVRVSTAIPRGLRVQADETAISRVFANLLDNAIKYTPRGGAARITAMASGGQVKIRVSDTGIGIAPDDLPRIWERLFRGDRSRSERGLGLGLSFVRAIVEAHGGTATATSQPGTGTAIVITLPLAAEKPALAAS
jgi:signal transduction histidine kinase